MGRAAQVGREARVASGVPGVVSVGWLRKAVQSPPFPMVCVHKHTRVLRAAVNAGSPAGRC
jgi:hypothetical protein